MVIVLDATDDVNINVMNKIKDLLKNLMNSYNISSTRTNIGLIAYSNTADVLVSLQSGTRKLILERSLETASPLKGPRVFSKAMGLAIDMLLKAKKDPIRSGEVTSQIIFISTGNNSDSDRSSFRNLVSQLKTSGISIIVLAVNQVDVEELEQAVSQNDDLIEVNDPRKMKEVLGQIEKRSGNAAGLCCGKFLTIYEESSVESLLTYILLFCCLLM